MNPRVILVKPPERSTFNFGTFSLAVLAASIRNLATVRVLDATERTPSQAAAAIWAERPDIIGITVMGLTSVRPVAELIALLERDAKRHASATKRALIVAGGHGASMLPEVLLDAGADGVVIGEGESTFQRILREGIQPGMPGMASLADDRPAIGPTQALIEPLDRIPLPARDLIPSPPTGIFLMETSRGCPHACRFCETTRFFGRHWRPHSPERVVREVRQLVDTHGAWIIQFSDDNFTANPVRVIDICARLEHESLPSFFLASARADDLLADPKLLPAMAKARIQRISVGVETLDIQTASAAGKTILPETYREVFRRMRELGMFSVASFIVGLPGETPRARDRAVESAIEAGPDSAHFLPFLPLPGVPLASGRNTYDPNPEDVRDGEQFTRAFFENPTVVSRLKTAAGKDGIRGMLARATLVRRTIGQS